MIIISFDETYHIQNGKPLYDSRYKRVMSFHDGIAPVEQDEEAFFINIKNEKLFDRIFEKAYGFYEGLSAVKDKDGWFHINMNGKDVYNKRYSWVGNFNENRCVVKDFQNNYFHIDSKGKRVYSQNYKYTGDFKYGIAVVISDNGKSTHIDSDGKLLHGKYFDELNIFHKGYAVAKDKSGYFHINKKGEELYSARYKKLEDFYNGFALATSFEGNKVIINEDELLETEITEPSVDKDKILNEVFGYFKYQILFAILKLDILDKIRYKKTISLPEVSLRLIYRWLYMEKIIDNNRELTQLGEVIEDELKSIILYWQDLPYKASAHMVDTLKYGNESFSKIFKKPYFDFLEENSEYLQLFSEIASFYNFDYLSLIDYLKLNDEVVTDIGGGDGTLIKMIHNKYPQIQPRVLDKFINTNEKNHIQVDFFKNYELKSDVFLLSRVLHDWDDESALKILQNISRNIDSNSILYIFETIVPKNITYDKGVTLSFHLLNFVGGYERTLADFKILLKKVNLKIVDIFDENKLISAIKVCKL